MDQPDPQSSTPDYGGDLYGEMLLAKAIDHASPPAPRQPLLPGLAICAVASIAAAWLSEHYGIPIILMGLLVGLSLNFLSADPKNHAGLDFASRNFLRVGIVLLGLQVTVEKIGALGVQTFAGLIAVMASAIVAAIIAARLSGQSRSSGILAGGATAICGASAALAIYGVLGARRVSQSQFALILVGISLASALAMSFYPLLASLLQLSDRQAGFLIGASIHDVAQAIGGGYAYSDAAGSYATIVKLSRVALLAPVVAGLALFVKADGGEAHRPLWKRIALPWFITGFLALVAINSVTDIPPMWGDYCLIISKALLLIAVTATAMRSRLDLLMQAGWRTIMPVMAATIASFLAALGIAKLLL